MTQTDVSRLLAEFAVGAVDGGPHPQATEATLDTLACCLLHGAAAAHSEPVRIAFDVARSLHAPAEASVLGHTSRVGVLWAPFLNGMAMHEVAPDPHAPATPGQLAAPIVAAALTAAELIGRSGADFVDAIRIGIDIALRVQRAIAPSHVELGWHEVGTVGRLGATLAAARLLNLDADHAVVALGLASVEASGVRAAVGSMTEHLHAAKAASDAVEAALLARQGLTGPTNPIEAPRGFGSLLASDADLDVIVDGLGTTWWATETTRECRKRESTTDGNQRLLDVIVSVRTLERIDPIFAAAGRRG